jgi:hypothetical protein
MTTVEIKRNTDAHLLYEQRIKTLAEPVLIKCLNDMNLLLSSEKVQERLPDVNYNISRHIYIINRGGDALNYYYPNKYYVPTHDFDLGIIYISPNNINDKFQLSQHVFNQLKSVAQSFVAYTMRMLNSFFRSNIHHDWYKNISFYIGPDTPRLNSIKFNYRYLDVERENAIVDIFIGGNVEQGVNYNSQTIFSLPHFYKKYDYYKITELMRNQFPNRNDLITYLINELKSSKTIFKNNYNYIIEDRTSHMKYIAPGDLANDTLRMIYQSIYNINISKDNNKLDKYLIKYSKLLDVINQINKLGSRDESYELSAFVLLNNTNNKDCDDNNIDDLFLTTTDWKNNLLRNTKSIFKDFYTQECLNTADWWNNIPTKKLCEMKEILQDDELVFNFDLESGEESGIRDYLAELDGNDSQDF